MGYDRIAVKFTDINVEDGFDFIGIVDDNDDLIMVYTGTYGFSEREELIRYNTAGVAIDSFTVGVGPNGFVF